VFLSFFPGGLIFVVVRDSDGLVRWRAVAEKRRRTPPDEVSSTDPRTDLPHGAEFGKKVVSLSRKKLKKLKIFPDPERRFSSQSKI